ncbi:hypothetical protein DIPPA_11609 [Diplonema papillatum]|nr:hypothetical protein DIPPA_11609 [Diplonema papillatum]
MLNIARLYSRHGVLVPKARLGPVGIAISDGFTVAVWKAHRKPGKTDGAAGWVELNNSDDVQTNKSTRLRIAVSHNTHCTKQPEKVAEQ